MSVRFSFRDPILKGNFRLFIGDFVWVERYLRARDFDPNDWGPPRAAKTLDVTRDGRHEILFWFPDTILPLTHEGAGLVAHEALHGVEFMFKARDVDVRWDEAANYYLEWLVTRLTRYLSSVRRRRVR